MEQRRFLSKTEMDIMSLFWNSQGKGFCFEELMEYANNSLGKGWKNWRMAVCLRSLQRKGMLKVDKGGSDDVYYSCCSKREYIYRWMEKGGGLTKEEAEELKKLIK